MASTSRSPVRTGIDNKPPKFIGLVLVYCKQVVILVYKTVLFIIFGLKHRDTDHGPSYPLYCRRCQNQTYYHAYGWRTWFHIFWIPLIPWTATRTLTCPICGEMVELNKADYNAAKDLVESTQRYRERTINEKQYASAIRSFEEQATFVEEPLDLEDFDTGKAEDGTVDGEIE